MKAVIQRVKNAALSVDCKLVSEIGQGLAVYFGVAKGDTEAQADYFARKIAAMRIFEDENGKCNFSVFDKGFEVLAISQFTLLADCSHGNRPDFLQAEEPVRANALYEHFVSKLTDCGINVKKGIFGADMKIEQLNDGPVTIILEK